MSGLRLHAHCSGLNFGMTHSTKLVGSTVFASLAMLFLSRTRVSTWRLALFLLSIFFKSRYRVRHSICVSFTNSPLFFDLEALWREEIARLCGGCARENQMPSIRGPWVEFTSSRDVRVLQDMLISALEAARPFCNRAMKVDTKPSRMMVHADSFALPRLSVMFLYLCQRIIRGLRLLVKLARWTSAAETSAMVPKGIQQGCHVSTRAMGHVISRTFLSSVAMSSWSKSSISVACKLVPMSIAHTFVVTIKQRDHEASPHSKCVFAYSDTPWAELFAKLLWWVRFDWRLFTHHGLLVLPSAEFGPACRSASAQVSLRS